MMMPSIQFDWVSAALLIVGVIPIAWGLTYLYQYRQSRLQDFAQSSILSVVLTERSNTAFCVKGVLFCIAWICAVIAIMQPKGNERYAAEGLNKPTIAASTDAELRRKHHTVILMIDASASMAIRDGIQGKSRLDFAKETAEDVISSLRGESVALFAFTSATMQIVPATMDYLFTRLMLNNIEINEGETTGTDIEGALRALKNQYLSKNLDTNKTLVILTDGGDTSLQGLTGPQLNEKINNIILPLQDAEKLHVRTLVVGIGSAKGGNVPGVTFQGKPVASSLEISLLKKLSAIGNGQLWLTSEMPIFEISKEISKSIQRDISFTDITALSPTTNDNLKIYDEYYQYPLGVAIASLAFCMLFPNASMKPKLRRSATNQLDMGKS